MSRSYAGSKRRRKNLAKSACLICSMRWIGWRVLVEVMKKLGFCKVDAREWFKVLQVIWSFFDDGNGIRRKEHYKYGVLSMGTAIQTTDK